MPVKEAHPDAVKLDEAFAAAMDTPGKPREPGPPPEVDNDAPFGRDDAGQALAPFGLTKEGRPKRSPAGRKPREDRARVEKAAPEQSPQGEAKKPSAAVVETRKYAPAIADTLEVFWLGGTVAADVGPKLPVLGRFMPDPVKLHAQAAALLACKDQLAGALDLCAQHNESARRLAEKLSTGNAGWALNAAFMLLPFIGTSIQVWGKEERPHDPETGAPLQTYAETLADQNRVSFQVYMEQMAEQMKAASQQVGNEQPATAA